MKKKHLINLIRGVGLLFVTLLFNSCDKLTVLNSKGPIGQRETELIIWAFVLMLIVVLPVFIMVFWFGFRYRDGNKKATYKPKWSDSKTIEFFIWIVPVAIIVVLSYLTWRDTHRLDPYKPIPSEKKALTVDVISTDWNWVFIYPKDSVATVNELVIEAGRPVSFELTSASVMTSFFIPQLGSQMYAMAGMRTKLNLLADSPGVFRGHNMEFSGDGYDSMQFKVIAKSPEEFVEWLKKAKQSPNKMDMAKFKEISQPTVGYPFTVYSLVTPDIFKKVMAPYMQWMSAHKMKMMKGDDHMAMPSDDMKMSAADSTNMSSSNDMKSMHMNDKNMEEK